MKLFSILLIALSVSLLVSGQGTMVNNNTQGSMDVQAEIIKLKDVINELRVNEQQSDRTKYQKNYQLIVNGLDIIKEMHQGTVEITGARSQNLLYKKLIDINNPSTDVLGFQLLDVLINTLENNISLLPLLEKEKSRLKVQVANIFEGLKKMVPPLQIITSAVSIVSSFNTYKPRIEKLSKKADSLVVDVTNPITKEVMQRITTQLEPYISFYTELNRTNLAFENALYQHEIEYRDFIDELNNLKDLIEKKINLNESITAQINNAFDITNSSSQDFNYKEKLNNDTIQDLLGNCISVYEMVDRYKKFTNDFIVIQDDFYKNNLQILQTIAKNLPFKDTEKINGLIAELNQLKNGDPASKTAAFDASYKLRLKSILAKLYSINKLRI
ncbi:MAG TPA: hypothetical protein VGQ09_05410 [Chitinophagaceae bacterium]|nr:hypothetical protein [Chitinophagaceae bacterium]